MTDDIIHPHHTILFNADLVSVNSFGNIMVLPVAFLPLLGAVANLFVVQNGVFQFLACLHETIFQVKKSIESPVFKTKTSSLRNDRSAHPVGVVSVDFEEDELGHGLELSPRLTNYIEKGVVPESLLFESKLTGQLTYCEESHNYFPEKFIADNGSEFKINERNELSVVCSGKILSSNRTVFHLLIEADNSGQRVAKFKKLLKHVDVGRELPQKSLYEEIKGATENCCRSLARTSCNYVKHIGGTACMLEINYTGTESKNFLKKPSYYISVTVVSANEDNTDSDNFESSFIADKLILQPTVVIRNREILI